MKRFGLIGVTLVVAGGLLVSVAAVDRPETAPKIIAGNAYGKVRPRNARPIAGGVSPQLIGHGGAVMNSAAVTSVFWGTAWSNSGYVGDKVVGLASFYAGLDASSYMKTNTEYSGSNGQVAERGRLQRRSVRFFSDAVAEGADDDRSARRRGPHNQEPRLKRLLPRLHGHPARPQRLLRLAQLRDDQRCARPVRLLLRSCERSGCDPGGDLLGHSPPLAALANVSGHEISEAVTDPRNGGWWDSSGAENADKCAWTFHTTVALTNDSQWRIQGNWSNNAYSAGAGYAKVGCIDGN